MNKKLIISMLVLIAVTLTGVTAQAASPFIRAGASDTYGKFDPLNREDGWKAGFALAGGADFGTTDQHEISLETGWAKWSGTTAVGAQNSKTTQIPVLLAYRYTFAVDNNWGIFVGPTAGFIYEKYEASDALFALLNGSHTTWRPAYGGTVGVSVKIAKGWDTQLAYQILEVNKDNYTTAGSFYHDPAYTRSSFQLSVGYKF